MTKEKKVSKEKMHEESIENSPISNEPLDKPCQNDSIKLSVNFANSKNISTIDDMLVCDQGAHTRDIAVMKSNGTDESYMENAESESVSLASPIWDVDTENSAELEVDDTSSPVRVTDCERNSNEEDENQSSKNVTDTLEKEKSEKEDHATEQTKINKEERLEDNVGKNQEKRKEIKDEQVIKKQKSESEGDLVNLNTQSVKPAISPKKNVDSNAPKIQIIQSNSSPRKNQSSSAIPKSSPKKNVSSNVLDPQTIDETNTEQIEKNKSKQTDLSNLDGKTFDVFTPSLNGSQWTYQLEKELSIPLGDIGPFTPNASLNKKVAYFVGDITHLKIDAYVNAANEPMIKGGGIDGVLHGKCGPQLQIECTKKVKSFSGNKCPTGKALITFGYNSDAKYIIATPGPRGGMANADQLLRDSYNNSLDIASKNGVKHIAFPCISTAIFGFSKPRAAQIALETVRNWLLNNPATSIELVVFVVYASNGSDKDSHIAYQKLIPIYFPK